MAAELLNNCVQITFPSHVKNQQVIVAICLASFGIFG